MATVGTSDCADILYRLANLYLAKKAYHDNQVGELEVVIYGHREAGEKQRAEQALVKQRRAHKRAKKAATTGIKLLSAIADNPDYASYK